MKLSENNWKAVSAALIGASGIFASELVRRSWKAIKKEEPPLNPASPHVSFGKALLLTSLIGLLGGVIKLTTSRMIAQRWQGAGGKLPDKKKV